MKPGRSDRGRQDPQSRLRFEPKAPEDGGTSGHVGPKSNKRRNALLNTDAATESGTQATPPNADATEGRAAEPGRSVPAENTAERNDTPTQPPDASPPPVSRPYISGQPAPAPATSGQAPTPRNLRLRGDPGGPKLKQGAMYQARHIRNKNAGAATPVNGGNAATSGHNPTPQNQGFAGNPGGLKSKKQRYYQPPKDGAAAQEDAQTPPPNAPAPTDNRAAEPGRSAPTESATERSDTQTTPQNPPAPESHADASPPARAKVQDAAANPVTPDSRPDAPATSGQHGPKSAQGGGKLKQDREKARPSDRLRHEDAPQGDPADPGGASKEAKKAAHEGKWVEQSKFRMEKSGEKLDAAREKLAAQKPPGRKGPVKALGNAAAGGVAAYAHGKIFQVEHENVGTESAHRTELAGEGAVRQASRRFRSRSNRVRSLERRELRAKSQYAYRKLKQEHPMKKPLSRVMQKQRIKRQYQKQARTAAKQGAKGAKRTVNTAGKAVRAVVNFVKRNPKILLIGLIAFLLVATLQSCVAAFMSIGNGLLGGGAGTSYLAEDTEIDSVEAAYLEWETLLTQEAQNAAYTYPGYNEYRYDIDPTGHDPYALISFLTAVYNDFTYSGVDSVLQDIFNEQYTLTFTPEVETRYRTESRTDTWTDEDGNLQSDTYDVDVPYDYYILNVELTARPFTDSLYPRMDAEQLERYNILMLTKGNRELNPLYFPTV